MKFNKSLDWLKESEEDTDDVFSTDELDQVEGDEEEQINEVRYINPANLDRYNPDEIEEVTTASGEKRYKRKSGRGSSAQGAKEKAGYNRRVKEPERGETYLSGRDVYYGHVEDIDEETADELRKAGMVNDEGEINIPAGAKMEFLGSQGGADVFRVNGIALDMDSDGLELMAKGEPESGKRSEPKIPSGLEAAFSYIKRGKSLEEDPGMYDYVKRELPEDPASRIASIQAVASKVGGRAGRESMLSLLLDKDNEKYVEGMAKELGMNPGGMHADTLAWSIFRKI